ncbi:lasso peptide biosynthesis B2 protein [Conexibacter sp. SYSU D00693]|uniref:lasso peptide biosynthesis B2 protein n=1 Tax=Conexibacter sp. SYSU D00693 TaxID=2812560 RepID=UPI00196B3BFE|nr:lasso peptide biosynthesis B2 protein [Conexibacter sp. SYSU D00693]
MPAAPASQPLPVRGALAPATKLRLVAEVLRTYAAVRRRMSREDLRDVLVDLRALAPGPLAPEDRDALEQSVRLGRVVSRTLGPLPVDATCLARSLVLVAMLARRSLPGTVVIGVKPSAGEGSDGEGFGAHAWVEVAGRPVLAPGAFARLTEL